MPVEALKFHILDHRTETNFSVEREVQSQYSAFCPLSMWTLPVHQMTQLSFEDDILNSYVKLLKIADMLIFHGKLTQDPKFWPNRTE